MRWNNGTYNIWYNTILRLVGQIGRARAVEKRVSRLAIFYGELPNTLATWYGQNSDSTIGIVSTFTCVHLKTRSVNIIHNFVWYHTLSIKQNVGLVHGQKLLVRRKREKLARLSAVKNLKRAA